jgi:hypothetical protein
VRSLLEGSVVQTVRDREHVSTSTDLKKYQSGNMLKRLTMERFNLHVVEVMETPEGREVVSRP